MYQFIRKYVKYSIKIEAPWLITIGIVFTLLSVAMTILYRKRKIDCEKCFGLILLPTYILTVIASTVFCRPIEEGLLINLQPLWKYRALLNGDVRYIPEIIVNIAMFAVVGFLLCLTFASFSKGRLLIIAGMMSFAIEYIQFVSHRGLAELDDIFNNTLGAAFGILLYSVYGVLRRWLRERFD